MKRIFPVFLYFLVIIFVSSTSSASIVFRGNIEDTVRNSQLAIKGMGLAPVMTTQGKSIPSLSKAAGEPVRMQVFTTSRIKVDKVLKNETGRSIGPGDIVEYKTFQGVNTAQGLVRPSVRLTKVKEGEEVIIFFVEKHGKLLVTGVDMGKFNVKNGKVTNPFMKTQLFRGVKAGTPGVSKALGAGKGSLSAPPSSIPVDNFIEMVETMAGDQGGENK